VRGHRPVIEEKGFLIILPILKTLLGRNTIKNCNFK
jgi:hypothetical protein